MQRQSIKRADTASLPSAAKGLTRLAFVVALPLLLMIGALTGCGSAPELPVRTIYVSVPLAGPLEQRGRDIVDAAKLALEQTRYDTPDVQIELRVLDSAADSAAARRTNPAGTPEIAVANYRRATSDPASLAYIGGLSAELSQATTEAASGNPPLQISLAPDARARDGREPRLRGDPESVSTIHLLPSRGSYSDAIAQARAFEQPLKQDRSIGTRGAANAAFAPDFPGSPLVPQADQLVTPALPPEGYPPAGERFFSSFEDAYGRRPDRFAIFGYEAMGLALNAITDAGEDDPQVKRSTVRDTALKIKNRYGPVGHYDVLPDGQTTLYIFAIRSLPLKRDDESSDARLIEVGR